MVGMAIVSSYFGHVVVCDGPSNHAKTQLLTTSVHARIASQISARVYFMPWYIVSFRLVSRRIEYEGCKHGISHRSRGRIRRSEVLFFFSAPTEDSRPTSIFLSIRHGLSRSVA